MKRLVQNAAGYVLATALLGVILTIRLANPDMTEMRLILEFPLVWLGCIAGGIAAAYLVTR